MQDMNLKTSILIVAVAFFIGVVLSTVLFAMSGNLPHFAFPGGMKLLFELAVYLISLFLFSNYKFKPALWVKGLLIILFFRILFSLLIGVCFYVFFAKPPITYGDMFIEALFRYNYSYLLQVLLSPCLSYPLLIAVITEKVELEFAASAPPQRIRTTAPPPPPPSAELPPEWTEDLVEGDKPAAHEGKNPQEISAELLKELGLADLSEETPKPQKTTPAPKPKIDSEPKTASMNDELKNLLSGLDEGNFFSELGDKKPKSTPTKPESPKVEPKTEPQKIEASLDELLGELGKFDSGALNLPPEEPKKPEIKPPEAKIHAEPAPTAPLDIDLPAFNIPDATEKAPVEEDALDVSFTGLENMPVEEVKPASPPKQKIPEPSAPKVEPERIHIPPFVPPTIEPAVSKAKTEAPSKDLLSEIELPPPVIPVEEPPSIEELTPAEIISIPELPQDQSGELDQLLAALDKGELRTMGFEEKPIISLEELPPLPDFPGITVETEKPKATKATSAKISGTKESKAEKTKEMPSSKELAQKPSDMITLSVRRIIDYGKTTEAAVVLNKLLRRGSDYKLQVPLSMVVDQLESGTISLSADYIYNQVPIELVNFISAEQGRNLQELQLVIPLADVMQQVSPAIIMERMKGERPDSKWSSEASELSEKISFEEKG